MCYSFNAEFENVAYVLRRIDKPNHASCITYAVNTKVIREFRIGCWDSHIAFVQIREYF